MSDRETGVEEARKTLGKLVDDAALDGTVTYLTRRGRPHAAIVPLSAITGAAVTKEEMRILIDLARAGENEGPWNWDVEPDSPTYTQEDASNAIGKALDLLDTLPDA